MTLVCPRCHTSGEIETFVACPACQTAHHLDCWNRNGGCTRPGCQYSPAVIAARSIMQAAAPAPAPEPESAPPEEPAEQKEVIPPGLGFYLDRGGVQSGPFTLTHLKKEFSDGLLLRSDKLCRDGTSNWVPAFDLLKGNEPVTSAGNASVHSGRAVAAWDSAFDPCPGVMRFGRLMYFGCNLVMGVILLMLGTLMDAQTALPGVLLFYAGLFVIMVLRARDEGFKGWVVLLSLIPIVNIWLSFHLAYCPRGYWKTKRSDFWMRFWIWFTVLTIASILLLVAIAIILPAVAGAVGKG